MAQNFPKLAMKNTSGQLLVLTIYPVNIVQSLLKDANKLVSFIEEVLSTNLKKKSCPYTIECTSKRSS